MRAALLLFAAAALGATAQEDPALDQIVVVTREAENALQTLSGLRGLDFGSVEASRDAGTLVEESNAMLGRLIPLLGRRQQSQQGYLDSGDVKRFESERIELNRRIDEEHQKLTRLTERFKELKQTFYMQNMAATLADYQSKRGTPQPGQKIGDAMAVEAVFRSMMDLRKKLLKSTDMEKFAFEKTKRSARMKRILGGVLILLAAIVLLGFFLAFSYGKKAAPTSAISGPVAAPAISGPVGAPAISGPVGGSPASTVPRAAPPEILGGNFRMGREIGRGGMGLVYEAVDMTLDRRVAIKKMKAEVLANSKELEMFLSEARLVASLKHPNLVEIHSIVREEGELYLVFEHVSGRALHALLENGSPIPHSQVKHILRQVADGLDYAHSRKVIHRDLKPSNIMLTEDGVAKIMDFGIAHQAKKTVAKLTRAEAWGTPPYMAPEQEVGTVSRESDIYALGVCCYEMLTGRVPFDGPNFLAQKRQMAYKPPSSAAGRIPHEMDAVIAQALQADPALRFHSAREFIAAFDTVPF